MDFNDILTLRTLRFTLITEIAQLCAYVNNDKASARKVYY